MEEDEDNYEISAEMKDVLDERLAEDEETYFIAEASINQINKKLGL